MFTHNTLKTVPLGNVCVLVQHALRPAFFGEILQQNQEQRCGPTGFHSQISLWLWTTQVRSVWARVLRTHRRAANLHQGVLKHPKHLSTFLLLTSHLCLVFQLSQKTVYLHINSQRNHTLNLVLCQHSLISAPQIYVWCLTLSFLFLHFF